MLPRLHTISTLGLLLVLVFGALFFLPLQPDSSPLAVSEAQTWGLRELNGWAWSSNIGWISFNCKNYFDGVEQDTCGSSNYKVAWDITDNRVKGDAWSSNIGWINFEPPSDFPESPAKGASFQGDNLVGWVRALAGDPPAGGWDGWIKLSGSWPGGITKSEKTDGSIALNGWAWGGDVVGWVHFDQGSTSSDTPCDPMVQVCIPKPDCFGDCELVAACRAEENGGDGDGRVESGESILWSVNVSSGQSPFDYKLNVPTLGGEIGSTNNSALTSFQVTTSGLTVPVGQDYLDVDYDGWAKDSQQPNNNEDTCDGTLRVYSTTYVPPSGGPGTLTITQPYKIITIRNQVSGQSAATIVAEQSAASDETGGLAAKITNNGSGPILNLGISTIQSMRPTTPSLQSQLDGEEPKCQLTSPYDKDQRFEPCSSVTIDNLSPGDSAYFRLQVPRPLKTIADWNPYKITLAASTDADSNPLTAPTSISGTIIFDYLVTTFDPI